MIGIIVIGHGHFASGLKSNVELIVGEEQYLRTVDFEASDSPDDVDKKIDSAIKELSECTGIIMLTDVLNGTPFNSAIKYSIKNNMIKTIYGVNAAMLLTLVMKNKISDDINEIAKELVEIGKSQIGLFSLGQCSSDDDL